MSYSTSKVITSIEIFNFLLEHQIKVFNIAYLARKYDVINKMEKKNHRARYEQIKNAVHKLHTNQVLECQYFGQNITIYWFRNLEIKD